jgi:hypothetical protein
MTTTFEVSEELVNMITEALTDLPYKRVQPVFEVLADELAPQLMPDEDNNKIIVAH